MLVALNLKSKAPHRYHAVGKNALGLGTAPHQNGNGC
jgi:hypothetical protein